MNDEYMCKGGQCIPQNAVCDGTVDCTVDGDDEGKENCECARNEVSRKDKFTDCAQFSKSKVFREKTSKWNIKVYETLNIVYD